MIENYFMDVKTDHVVVPMFKWVIISFVYLNPQQLESQASVTVSLWVRT